MSKKLPHGFKAQAERISLEVRVELGLALVDRLDALSLAAYLEIPVISLLALRASGAADEEIQLIQGESAKFSALTVIDGTHRLIVYNHRHPPGRQANSLAHELSHTILEHSPSPVLGDGGCRHWNSQYEDEADWLAGALLVPREGVLNWLRGGGSEMDGAQHFGVSRALFSWRAHHSGVLKQLESWRRMRSRG
ncbi:MAG: ImmA/IrrE family metallo-endopeptidase [Nitrospirae bacterium]|nr:MAG: ImmA/IrrE family metallo-endopeptidase [Nitrospirota bacterium]